MRGKPLERKRWFFFSFLHLTAEQAEKKKRMLELTDHDVLCCSSVGWDITTTTTTSFIYISL